jgi:hypothetical protein
MKLFELFNTTLELKNNVKHHLSDYPYLSYSLKDVEDGIIITFTKELTSMKYAKNILYPYHLEILDKTPIKFKIKRKKKIEKFKEYNGKMLIGNIVDVDFIDLNIWRLETKVDTGATTSSIHCSEIDIDEETKTVRFVPLDKSYEKYKGRYIEVPIIEQVRVKSSNGGSEIRPLVMLKINIHGKKLDAFFSLTNREDMEYPALLGNDIIIGNFIVDPTLD